MLAPPIAAARTASLSAHPEARDNILRSVMTINDGSNLMTSPNGRDEKAPPPP